METGRKIRVCHIITRLELGGAQENTLALVDGLPENSYETHLICGAGGMLDAAVRERLGARLHFVPSLVRQVRPALDLAAFFSLRRLLRAGCYDIAHTHSSKAGIIGRMAARSAGVPLILHTAHGWGFHDGQNAAVRGIFTVAERAAASRCDVIVAVSEATKRRGIAAGIGREDQYAVIREGIDPRPFQAPADAQALKRKLGFDPSRPLISMIACLKPQKSPFDFLDVAARVSVTSPGAVFALAGDGELRGDMEWRIKRLGLEQTVRLLGWRRDIPDILRASDLSILTSRWEGLPRAVLESIASGVPVIATAVDGTPEAVVEGVNGFLAAPGDTEKMASIIADLLTTPDKLRALRKTVASTWREDFDLHRMVHDTDHLYWGRRVKD